MPRRLLAGWMANGRVSLLLLLVLTGTEVRGHVSEPSSSNSNSVRTVMDLMEVMLNRNILDMLQNGGFDFREPARIFLPPKFYSTVPLDQGHMSPDQILTYDQQRKGFPGQSYASVGGKAIQQQKPSGAVTGDKPTGRSVVSEPAASGGSRINLISYSDGKVTTAGGVGNGGRPAVVTNKGSETLEKNVATNGRAGVGPTLAGTNFQERINGKEMMPANEQQQQQRWQPSLTTSITDQTVSQNVGRTLPTSGRYGGGSSTTDRLRSALPGEPDVDYPILGSIPPTQFSCERRHHGYYADVETRCQVFRVCANTDSTGRGFAFLCPNGTLFNQRHLVCDWYMNVRCEESENFYHLNDHIGGVAGGRSMVSDNRQDMMKVVMSMVTYPMRSLMDMMNGVGVIEERVGGLQERLEVVPMPPSSRRDDYVTPGTGLEPPLYRERTGTPGSVNNFSPVMNNLVAGVSSPVRPAALQDAGLSNVYRPKLDNVYVSSLGTLSTDPDSGFDPLRSTLLTSTDGTAVGQPTGVPRTQTFGVTNVNQPGFVRPAVATDIQLVRADLVKSWDDQAKASPPQSPSLRLAPVSRPPSQPQFSFQPPQQTTQSVLQQGAILPPTGVLPPSSFTRTVSIGGTKKYNTDPSVHRFAPVRTVLPIQKVTVVPESSYQMMQGNFHTRLGNFYPSNTPSYSTTPAANFPYTVQPQTHVPAVRPADHYPAAQQVPVGYNRDVSSAPSPLLRRSDVRRANPTPMALVSPRRLQTTTVLQVVPSLSFYLNDAEEKRAFDEAVRQGLFDERRRSRTVSSYDVPLGSVGRLGSTVA